VQPDFVPGVADHGTFFGERFERVARDEPGCGNGVFGEELEEAADADGAAEEALEWGRGRGPEGRTRARGKRETYAKIPRLMSEVLFSPP